MLEEKKYHCPVEATMDVIGGKWKLLIIHYLLEGTKRFNELQKAIPAVTQRMLTSKLRELEKDGIVHRKVYAEVPPKVEYSMTEFGRTVESMLWVMHDWGKTFIAKGSGKAMGK
ncbi:MAG: MarR family transcriptional regulator [Deltaproteobacteria bacterium]|nr:MAG: MarR family transcriptional regulator [Deltaproteobacteria bacterium]